MTDKTPPLKPDCTGIPAPPPLLPVYYDSRRERWFTAAVDLGEGAVRFGPFATEDDARSALPDGTRWRLVPGARPAPTRLRPGER